MKTCGCLILFSYLVFGGNCQLKLEQYDPRMEAQGLQSICILIYYILSDCKKKILAMWISFQLEIWGWGQEKNSETSQK